MVKFFVYFLLSHSLNQAFAQDLDFHIAPSKIHAVQTNQFTLNKLKKFQSEHKRFFSQVNRSFEYWLEQDQMNDLWGYTAAGFYIDESRKAKMEVLQNEFFQYLSYRVRRNPLRGELEVWRMGLRRDYEIDQRSILSNGQKTFSYDGENINNNSKTKRKKKKKRFFKFRFKPYLFRGLLVTSLTSKLFETHLFTGANKEVELRVVSNLPKIKLRFGSDYEFFNKRLLSYADKSFGKYLRVRLSAQKFMTSDSKLSDTIHTSLRYFRRF